MKSFRWLGSNWRGCGRRGQSIATLSSTKCSTTICAQITHSPHRTWSWWWGRFYLFTFLQMLNSWIHRRWRKIAVFNWWSSSWSSAWIARTKSITNFSSTKMWWISDLFYNILFDYMSNICFGSNALTEGWIPPCNIIYELSSIIVPFLPGWLIGSIT